VKLPTGAELGKHIINDKRIYGMIYTVIISENEKKCNEYFDSPTKGTK
jgi:hypothetical protein